MLCVLHSLHLYLSRVLFCSLFRFCTFWIIRNYEFAHSCVCVCVCLSVSFAMNKMRMRKFRSRRRTCSFPFFSAISVKHHLLINEKCTVCPHSMPWISLTILSQLLANRRFRFEFHSIVKWNWYIWTKISYFVFVDPKRSRIWYLVFTFETPTTSLYDYIFLLLLLKTKAMPKSKKKIVVFVKMFAIVSNANRKKKIKSVQYKKKCDTCITRLYIIFWIKEQKKKQELPKRLLEHTKPFVDYIYALSVNIRLRIVCMSTYREFKTRRPREDKNGFLLVFCCECGRCVHHTHKTKQIQHQTNKFHGKFNNLKKKIDFPFCMNARHSMLYTNYTLYYIWCMSISEQRRKSFGVYWARPFIYLLRESLFHCYCRFCWINWWTTIKSRRWHANKHIRKWNAWLYNPRTKLKKIGRFVDPDIVLMGTTYTTIVSEFMKKYSMENHQEEFA